MIGEDGLNARQRIHQFDRCNNGKEKAQPAMA
jgi:hypothetical protein